MPDTSRPNILFITTDQQRYDTLNSTGNDFVRTPNIDGLAAAGTLFTDALIQNTVCIPSRACMYTGRYTHQHGQRYMETIIDATPWLPAREVTVPERLRQAGYYTAAFGKIHMRPPRGWDYARLTGGKGARWTQSEGLDIGPGPLGATYAAWLESRRPGAYEQIYEQRRQPEYREYATAITNVLALDEYVDVWTPRNCIDFIRRAPSQPWFVQCGFCGPHGPMDPPEPYASMYRLEDIPLPELLTADLSDKPALLRNRSRGRFRNRPEVCRRVIAYYWALVNLIDDMVGEIVQALRDTGQWENTLIVFVSDHGEMLCDFDMLGKGNFYQPVVRVPLIIRAPGAPRGQRCQGLVETFDVAATMLDYAGIEAPPTMAATSLRPAVEGRPHGKEMALSEYSANDLSFHGKCLRAGRWKYIFWGREHGEELYDLGEDPQERVNRAADAGAADTIAEMRLALLDKLTASEQPILEQGELPSFAIGELPHGAQ